MKKLILVMAMIMMFSFGVFADTLPKGDTYVEFGRSILNDKTESETFKWDKGDFGFLIKVDTDGEEHIVEYKTEKDITDAQVMEYLYNYELFDTVNPYEKITEKEKKEIWDKYVSEYKERKAYRLLPFSVRGYNGELDWIKKKADKRRRRDEVSKKAKADPNGIDTTYEELARLIVDSAMDSGLIDKKVYMDRDAINFIKYYQIFDISSPEDYIHRDMISIAFNNYSAKKEQIGAEKDIYKIDYIQELKNLDGLDRKIADSEFEKIKLTDWDKSFVKESIKAPVKINELKQTLDWYAKEYRLYTENDAICVIELDDDKISFNSKTPFKVRYYPSENKHYKKGKKPQGWTGYEEYKNYYRVSVTHCFNLYNNNQLNNTEYKYYEDRYFGDWIKNEDGIPVERTGTGNYMPHMVKMNEDVIAIITGDRDLAKKLIDMKLNGELPKRGEIEINGKIVGVTPSRFYFQDDLTKL